MITLCHAIDDAEVMFLRAMLQSEDIPFTIVGEHFGSLYPGVQIAAYNERRFMVPIEFVEKAESLVHQHRHSYEPSFVNLTGRSKLRIIFETFFLGWCFPNGKKKDH